MKSIAILLVERTNKVIYVGKYQDGKKIEIWDIKNNNMRM